MNHAKRLLSCLSIVLVIGLLSGCQAAHTSLSVETAEDTIVFTVPTTVRETEPSAGGVAPASPLPEGFLVSSVSLPGRSPEAQNVYCSSASIAENVLNVLVFSSQPSDKTETMSEQYRQGFLFADLFQVSKDGVVLSDLPLETVLPAQYMPVIVATNNLGTVYLLCENLSADQAGWEVLTVNPSRSALLSSVALAVPEDVVRFTRFAVDDKGAFTLTALCSTENQTIAFDPFGNLMDTTPISSAAQEETKPTSEDAAYASDVDGFHVTSLANQEERVYPWSELSMDSSAFSYYTRFVPYEDGSVALIGDPLGDDSSSIEVSILCPTDTVNPTGKTILTVGICDADPNALLLNAVDRYNASSTAYSIQLRNYRDADKLFTDIQSGQGPDLLYGNEYFSSSRLEEQGLLLDMTGLMSDSAALAPDQVLTHVFDLYAYEGKHFTLPIRFAITGVSGSTLPEGSGWTLESFATFAEPYAKSAQSPYLIYAQPYDILSATLHATYRNFVNWDDRTCSFDSAAFIAQLEFAKSYGVPDAVEYQEALIRFGKIDGIDNIADLKEKGLVFKSFPRNDQDTLTLTRTDTISILRDTEAPKEAFRFIETLFSADCQSAIEAGFDIPLNRQVLDEHIAAESDRISPEEGAAFLTYLETLNASPEDFDLVVFDIVSNEVASYFDGDASAAEAAATIQDLVSKYLSAHK